MGREAGNQRNTAAREQRGGTQRAEPDPAEQWLLRLYWAAMGVVLAVAVFASSAPTGSLLAAILLAGFHPLAYHFAALRQAQDAARVGRHVDRRWLLALDAAVGLGVYFLTGATGTSHLLTYFIMGLAAARLPLLLALVLNGLVGLPFSWVLLAPLLAGRPDRLGTLVTDYAGFIALTILVNFLVTAQRELRQQREEAVRLLDEAMALYGASRAVSASLDVEETLRQVTAEVARATGLSRLAIYLVDEEHQALVFGAGTGLLEKEIDIARAVPMPIAKLEPARRQVLAGQTLAIHDVIGDPRTDQAIAKAWNVVSMLGVPLIARGHVVGTMFVDEPGQRREFSEREIRLAEGIAAQAAVAIENARLYTETQRLAITDGLTGLYNRRYLFYALERELARNERYSRGLTLILLDLDGFKGYNDTYGHPAGDRLLQEVARVLKSVMRKTDIAARYGGDEFALLLPETDQAAAVALAERLREVVQKQCEGRVTVSAGVACTSAQVNSLQALVQAADDALYRAKAHKNKVCV